jgi:transposase
MMGARQVEQNALFYEFSVEGHVPADHLLRSVDRFVDLGELRGHLALFYSETGRPSADPELMIRMLLIGYCLGIRSERRVCEELHLNLAYRWFCGLGLEGRVQTTRRSRKAVMAASAIAISCAICSRRCWRVH